MRRTGFFTLLLAMALLPGIAAAVTPKASPISAQSETIPFRYSNGFILIQGSMPQLTESLTFLLDSGAAASVLDLRAANRLGMPLGAPLKIRGVGSESVAYHVPATPATCGSATPLTNIDLAVDLSNAQKICEERVDGLIGVDFFKNRVVQIDYAARCLRFPTAKNTAGAEMLPIRLHNGMFCVPVAVNGSHSRWTRLDTGCNDALHWVIPRRHDSAQQRGVSIGFVTNDDDQSLTSVRLGKRSLDAVETSLHGTELFPGEAGLLGNGILSRFTVTVDGVSRRIYLQPSSSVAASR